jgi:hypothetical protein
MKSLIIYESMFGNTAEVAAAIATGLTLFGDVDVRDVNDLVPQASDGFDLVVAGGPTHAFSMTRPGTRAEAVKSGASQGTGATGLREWLGALSKGPHSQLVATFDTRVDKVRHLPGSAAKSADKVLHHRGYIAVLRPESFYVSDKAGPLLPGELNRAGAWGESLGAEALRRVTGQAPV